MPRSRSRVLLALTATISLVSSGCASSNATPSAPLGSSATSATPTDSEVPSPTASQLATFDIAELEAAAESEGSVTIYVTGDSIPNALGDAFKAKYPWFSFTKYGQSLTDVSNKFTAEYRSGIPGADVVFLTGVQRAAYKQGGMMAPFRTPAEASLPPDSLDSEGFVHPFFRGALVLMYNKNLVTDPPSIEELTDPAWKGALIMDSPLAGAVSFTFLSHQRKVMGDQRWRTWLEGLKANDVRIAPTNNVVYQSVLSGENSIGFGSYQDVFNQDPAAPVAAHFWPELEYYDLYWMIPPNAPHPNLARMFVNFAQSAEGQSALAATGRSTLIGPPDFGLLFENFVPEGTRILGLSDYQEVLDDPDFFLKIYADMGWG